MTWTCASKESLMTLKDVDEGLAEQLRAVWKSGTKDELFAAYPPAEDYARSTYTPPRFIEIKRWAVDRLFDTCGVEFLGVHRRSGKDVFYCNAGDSYAVTILFCSTTLSVGTWAGMVEGRLIEEPSTTYY